MSVKRGAASVSSFDGGYSRTARSRMLTRCSAGALWSRVGKSGFVPRRSDAVTVAEENLRVGEDRSPVGEEGLDGGVPRSRFKRALIR